MSTESIARRHRLAIVRSAWSPFGGAERFVAQAVEVLTQPTTEQAAAWDVTILARKWSGPEGASASNARVSWIKVAPFSIGRLWRDWAFARAVSQVVGAETFDIVQSHERIVGLPVFRAGDGLHADWLEARQAALTGWARWRVTMGTAFSLFHRRLLLTEKRMLTDPRLRAVICNSEMVRQDIVRRFGIAPSKLVLIRNGVDLQRFKPSDPMHCERARLALGLAPQDKVLIHVGSGYERKGVGPVLKALALYPLEARPILLVVGKEKSLSHWKRLALRLGVRDQVRWLGARTDVPDLLAAADVFVLATWYDPSPNAALEALASGLPVVVGQRCGVAELLSQGDDAGLVVDPSDSRSLQRAFDQLFHPDRNRLARIAARRLAERHPMNQTVEALVALYQRLVRAP